MSLRAVCVKTKLFQLLDGVSARKACQFKCVFGWICDTYCSTITFSGQSSRKGVSETAFTFSEVLVD